MLSYLAAILLFGVMILFHELGHFLLAKANGIRVNAFFLGFGPKLLAFTIGETEYSIRPFPFGGACVMEGEDGNSEDPKSFGNKSVWARMSVVLAGPVFNFIMALVFSFILIVSVGYQAPVLTDVIEGYAAEAAGMQAGDEIVAMNGHGIHFYNEISNYAAFHEGEAVEVTYKRNGEKFTTSLQPKYDEEAGRYLYGFLSSSGYQKASIPEAVLYSFYQVRYVIDTTIQSLRMLVTGMVGVNEMSGPVGIVQAVGQTVEESASEDGFFYAFLNLLNMGILLSANLGVMNLLPLPALDGGRFFFMLIEAIRGKRIEPEKEGLVHTIGLLLLLGLMVFVMFNDIRKLFM